MPDWPWPSGYGLKLPPTEYERRVAERKSIFGCVDCGQPLRGDVLRECQNPECGMYADDNERTS